MGEQSFTRIEAMARIKRLAMASEQFDEGLIDLDEFFDTVIRVSADLTESVAKVTARVDYQALRLERDKIREQLDRYLSSTAKLDEPEVIKATMQAYHERIRKLM